MVAMSTAPRRCRFVLPHGLLVLPAFAFAIAAAPPARADVPDTAAESIEHRLADDRFENVSVRLRDGALLVAFENRRLRSSADALAEVARYASLEDVPLHAFVRRLGLVSEQVDWSHGRFWVMYPSDPQFPPPPGGPVLSPTRLRPDLDIGPLLTYQMGRIFDPVQLRVEIEPRLHLNPWPGAFVTAGVLLPARNDFEPSPLEPDIDRVRPGAISLQQFAWAPGAALVSASAGYFGDNRYGGSFGLAKPLLQGDLLLDAQADYTGFLAFPKAETEYSPLERVTGFAGATWRPPVPGVDIALTARVARFVFGDQGIEVEARRTMGDFELAYFGQSTAGLHVFGFRVRIPIPPGRRAAGVPLRVQPVQSFAMDLNDRSEPVGQYVTGVASRAEFLRRTSAQSLNAEVVARTRRRASAPDWVSNTGTTGFVNTPWAGAMADRSIESGYNYVSKKWAYERRGTRANGIVYTTVGFLPHVEASMRWTDSVGQRAFADLLPDSPLPEIDRMASVRVSLLEPGVLRPGLALGVEDIDGTRRFHSTYAVTGTRFVAAGLSGRTTFGYGFRALTAQRRTLDGAFGALELSPVRWASAQIEYDTEKWNSGLGVSLPFGLRARAALLHMESLSVGAGWSLAL